MIIFPRSLKGLFSFFKKISTFSILLVFWADSHCLIHGGPCQYVLSNLLLVSGRFSWTLNHAFILSPLIFCCQYSYCSYVGSPTPAFYIGSLWNPFHLFLHFLLIYKAFLFFFLFFPLRYYLFILSCVSSSLIFISELGFHCSSNSLLSSLTSFVNFVILSYVILFILCISMFWNFWL